MGSSDNELPEAGISRTGTQGKIPSLCSVKIPLQFFPDEEVQPAHGWEERQDGRKMKEKTRRPKGMKEWRFRRVVGRSSSLAEQLFTICQRCPGRVFRRSVAEYEKLEDQLASTPYELIRGIIVNKMSRLPLHTGLTNVRATPFSGWCSNRLTARQEGPLPSVGSMLEPDVAIMRRQEKEFSSRRSVTAGLVGAVAFNTHCACPRKRLALS